MTNQTDLISEVRAALQAYQEGQHGSYTTLLMNAPTWLQQLSDRLEEAVKELQEILENTDPNDWYYGGIHKDASETLKRIKG